MSSNYQQVAIDTTTAHAARIRQASALPALIDALRLFVKLDDGDEPYWWTGRPEVAQQAAREALAKAGVRT